MQIKNCKYANVCRCAIDTFRKDGYLSFYRSYPATVLLNVPVFVTNFVTYEGMKQFLGNGKDEQKSLWYIHLLSGAIAGGLAGIVSNPLDVIKTTIQTDPTHGYLSIPLTLRRLLHHDQRLGYRVLMAGVSARAFYMIPSAAITWTTYEAVKVMLGFPVHDLDVGFSTNSSFFVLFSCLVLFLISAFYLCFGGCFANGYELNCMFASVLLYNPNGDRERDRE
ncbi:MC family transporter [Reticulomyxa filosa]|uniref:MC family transporter n=1 Tax=Reticulomyxa filosa TaxID=46433 RepID=X6MCF1_RETFI|nr:MC family transporter [Reticulomyxa filosa]|eukprot:ETO10715.1 MC family transporter [Reticulomyxa filosa]